MFDLIPRTPVIPVSRQDTLPVCEWVVPARAMRRRDHFSTYKILPPGKPDYLYVSTEHDEEGTGRCTAAVYGGRAYVIHFEFKPR